MAIALHPKPPRDKTSEILATLIILGSAVAFLPLWLVLLK